MADVNWAARGRKFLPVWTLLIGILIGAGLLWQWRKSGREAQMQELPQASSSSGLPNMASKRYTLETATVRAMEGMTCEQCDEMFQECLAEIDPDYPGGYEVCQILWA